MPLRSMPRSIGSAGPAELPGPAHEHQRHADLSSVQVPAPGEWTLRMWRRDQAGNADESNASNPVTLRYDPEAPKLSLAPNQRDWTRR